MSNALIASPAIPVEVRSQLSEMERLAEHFIKSGYFKDRNLSQVVVKICKGRSLGIDDFTSVDQINMIQGKPTLNANLLAALIRRSKIYDYEIVELSDTVCIIRMFKNGKPMEPPTRFGIDDAQRAGLTRNATYKAYPQNMLFARCISNAARFHAPDVTTGLYVPEDFPDATLQTNSPATITFPANSVNGSDVQTLLDVTNTTLEELNENLGTSFTNVEEVQEDHFAVSFLKSKKEARG